MNSLDRPIWSALAGRQHAWAEGTGAALRFIPSVAPFAGTPDDGPGSLHNLQELLAPGEAAALFTRSELEAPRELAVVQRGLIDQMVLDGVVRLPSGDLHRILSDADIPNMLDLVEQTRPGPFSARTIELGSYLALEENGSLVAMAGERFKPDGCTEISAVCVRPSHRGRGLAAGLVVALSRSVLARGELPFLHVFATNAAAIGLYGKLGFVRRCQLHLAVIGKPAEYCVPTDP